MNLTKKFHPNFVACLLAVPVLLAGTCSHAALYQLEVLYGAGYGYPISGTLGFSPISLTDGDYDFISSGSPVTFASVTADSLATNLPNQNDDYRVSGDVVTAMKYDFYNGLALALDGTAGWFGAGGPFSGTYTLSRTSTTVGIGGEYTVFGQVGFIAGESGAYSGTIDFDDAVINSDGTFAFSGGEVTNANVTGVGGTATNLPNANDDYTTASGIVTALKYDFYNGLTLALDGTAGWGDLGDQFSGTYTLTIIPEPGTLAALGLLAVGCFRRRQEEVG